jgi:ATP-dependent protease ClpP protease subunit
MLFFRNFIRLAKLEQQKDSTNNGLNIQIENNSRPFYFRLHGKINKKVVSEFEEILLNCSKTKQNILPIVINSTGGCAYSLISLYESIKKSKIKIATIVESKALSAGAFLLSYGNKGYRYMAKDATFMIHDVHTADSKPDLKEIERLNKVLYKTLEDKSFKDIMQNNNCSDLYLSAEQCLEYKIIDFIGIPTLKIILDQ